MKLINEGNKDWKPWYAGKHVKCSECNQVVELEATDKFKWEWMPEEYEKNGNVNVNYYFNIHFPCSRCGSTVYLRRE